MAINREVLGSELRQKDIPVSFTVDASSNPTLKVGAKAGITVTKVSTGKLKVQLDKAYSRTLGITQGIALPGAAAPADGNLTIDDTNLTVDGSFIVWTSLVAAPTVAANLANGTRIDLLVCVSANI